MRVRRSTTKGWTSPPSCTSSKKMTLRSMRASLGLDRPFGHDEGVARVRHDLVALVAVLALHQDEQHLAAARALLLEDVLGARAHPEHVAGVDGLQVLELLLTVEEPAHVELDGAHAAARRPLGPVRDRHEEGGRRERRVADEGGIAVLDGAREFADLPVLHPQGGLGPPLTDGGPVDLPGHPKCRALRSRDPSGARSLRSLRPNARTAPPCAPDPAP